MKQLKRIVSFALAVAVGLGLLGCAPAQQAIADPSARSDGKVYVESTTPLDLPVIHAIVRTPGGEYLAVTAQSADSDKLEMCVLDEAGAPLSSQALELKAGDIVNMAMGLDGKAYILERQMGETPAATESAPEEAQASTDEEAAKAAEAENAPVAALYARAFTAQGGAEAAIELQFPADKKSLAANAWRIQADEQGRIYTAVNIPDAGIAAGGFDILRFAPDGKFDSVVASNVLDSYLVLPGGDIFVMEYDAVSIKAKRIEMQSNTEKLNVKILSYLQILAYNPTDNCVYGYGNGRLTRFDESESNTDAVFLSDFSLMSPMLNVEKFFFDEDESIQFIVHQQLSPFEQMQAVLDENTQINLKRHITTLKLADAKDVPKKKVITVSVMIQDLTMAQAASAFQSLHPEVIVKVRELVPLSEMDYTNAESVTDYIKKVNIEILTGRASDIIALYGLPFQQYQKKNLLLDISGYIKKDPDFNDDNYFMNIINAYQEDGKQYALPKNFYALLLMAPNGLSIPAEGFSLKEFIAFCDTLPADKVPLGTGTPESIFQLFVLPSLSYFIDIRQKTAKLDSPEFIELLEASARIGKRGESFKADITDAASYMQYVEFLKQNVIFQQTYLFDYNYRAIMAQMMGQDGMILPFPGIEGPSRIFLCTELYGINKAAKEKDLCWEFLKFIVSEDFLKMTSSGRISINRKVDRQILDTRIAMEAKDDKKNMMTGLDGKMIEMPKLTRADADVAEGIIAGLKDPMDYDERLIKMLTDEVKLFFEGQKDAQATAASMQSSVNLYLSE